MIGLPPSESAAPRRKSSWPPMPLYWRVPMLSAQTWPVRSISIAPLIATTFGLRPMIAGSFT